MSLVNPSRLEIKLGEYATGSATALEDPQLVNVAQDYRRFTAQRMAPLEADDILKRFPPGEYHVSLKVDGEFDILVYDEGETLTVNPGGTVRVGLPLHKEAAALLRKGGVRKAILAGELYFQKAKRPRVHDVSKVARQPASQAELDALAFAAFDIIQLDGLPHVAPYAETWAKLTQLLQGGKNVHVVETVVLKDAGEIDSQFRKWNDSGAEGTVVRNDTVGVFKLKPRHTLDAVIIGFTESPEQDRKGMIHDLLVAVMRADGCLHVLGHVGGGFTNDDRRAFLTDLKDDVVKSDYVEVNDQVAYHMVRPESVIEISVLDLIAQTTRNQPINKMVLNWNSGENKYEIVRRLPLAALISPQFVRRRDDKMLNANDIRIQQITDLVEVALADRDARQLNLPGSTLIRREVMTKVLKGNRMVRKLVMWQTNKESDAEHWPAYVIHYTDFSPNRKTPLERDIRISSSREQIEELWGELAAEAFVKGWVPAGGPPPETTAVAEAPPEKKKRAPRKKKTEE
jgi:ATP-dependent DNA ligase